MLEPKSRDRMADGTAIVQRNCRTPRNDKSLRGGPNHRSEYFLFRALNA